MVVYGAMGRAREGWGDVWGDGKGAGGIGRYMGGWKARMRHRVVYGSKERAFEGWGGVWGDEKGAGGIEWCMGR